MAAHPAVEQRVAQEVPDPIGREARFSGQAVRKPPATAAKPATRGRAPKPESPKVRKAKATVAAQVPEA
ncbi:MAG: hypothetical protein A2X23_06855 [Chloroflexi bacterium GWC2_73_18]|nr:MAG: hypothetical protein A2X23_06855 [Chloroflexi bacterium GWC2_73_18]